MGKAMTSAQIAIARRWVALRGWRWMPGMMADCTHRRRGVCGDSMPVQRARVILGLVAEPVSRADVVCWREVPRDALPDVTDPATLGCLLALARGITERPWLHATYSTASEVWWCAWRGSMGHSESGRWLAACEAHEREVPRG